MTFCVAAVMASLVRSPSSSSCWETSSWIWAATSSLARARSSCLASRTAARRSFVAAWASRTISRHSFIDASSRSSSLMASSSLADRAKAAPAPAGKAVAYCGDDVLRDQQPAGDMAGGSTNFMDQRTWPFLVLHVREQAERYLARLSTSTVPAGGCQPPRAGSPNAPGGPADGPWAAREG